MHEQRVLSGEEPDATDNEHAEPDNSHEHPPSGGGARYQEAHRQNAVERDGPTRSRAARGTGPDHAAPRAPAGTDIRPEHPDGQPDATDQTANDRITDDDQRVRPQPDDEVWLNDLGYPKVGKHVESHATQIEHGPNAGGTQQGHAETASGNAARRRDNGSE